MDKKIIAKEELLSMLTEISDQLEELEGILETSLSKARQNVQSEYTAKIIACEEQLTALENETANTLKENEALANASKLHRPNSMKLELGY
ncbi:hypothetical protein ACFFHH_08090 [Cytobacillus solani]|uniref:Uncharacterized protein n=1 Tax=Cytobacillus solani TaxID=1637975 RepID=A0A0Q3TA76_9BACI|nr:hypothetical protein [Cytobacillus solani]KOP83202.1 hypothetical protein AMS60_12390 [Bacillus sp. FJAT-21945]KQL20229.1 hypothetical protein AN957_17700 [Cytobacillus solani]USK53484.1 hypothetical protein LIS82_17990 [Cytobacillus solani]